MHIYEAELCGYYGLQRVVGALRLCSLSGQFLIVIFIVFDMIYSIFMGRMLSGVSLSSSSYMRVTCLYIYVPNLQIIGQ